MSSLNGVANWFRITIEYVICAAISLLIFTVLLFGIDALVYAALLLNVDLSSETRKVNPSTGQRTNMSARRDSGVDNTTSRRGTTNQIPVPVSLLDQVRLCRVPRTTNLDPRTRIDNVPRLIDLFPLYAKCALAKSWSSADE